MDVVAAIESLARRVGVRLARPTARDVARSLQERLRRSQTPAALRTECLSVCFLALGPREKLGLELHGHPPASGRQPDAAGRGAELMAMAFMKQPMRAALWLIVPNPALDQHPDNNVAWWREALADPSPLLPHIYFRIERQTT